MNPFLLDTVVLSELRKKEKAAPAVLSWQALESGRQAYVSVITMNEIWFGCRKVRLKDPAFADRLEIWFEEILAAPDFFVILPITLPIARAAADLRADHGLSPHDSLIGATALDHGLCLATRNTADFETTSIPLFNPWEFKGGPHGV